MPRLLPLRQWPSQRGSMTGQFWGARCVRRTRPRIPYPFASASASVSASRPRSTLSTLRSTTTFGFPHFPVRVARQPVGVEMKYVDESLINLRHDKTSGVSVSVSVCICICNCASAFMASASCRFSAKLFRPRTDSAVRGSRRHSARVQSRPDAVAGVESFGRVAIRGCNRL